jgi:hypothetical protein
VKIPFSAYAEDCTVQGEVSIEMDRLSDFLAATEEFEIQGAAFRALDDGRVVESSSATLVRGDLCAVAATGPRGRPERRLWTRQFPVRVRVGPYVVVGYLHSPPTIDPFQSTDRRVIVALTETVVEYAIGNELRRDRSDAVLLNGRRIDRMEQVDRAELGGA